MHDAPEPDPHLIDLREFLGVLRRRKVTLAIVAVAVVGLALLLVFRRTPVYSSTARVEVRPLTAEANIYGYFYDLQSSMDTEAQRVTSQPVAERASVAFQATTGESADGLALADSVSVGVPANTTYLDITCTTPSPERSAACADAFAVGYVEDRTAFAESQYADAAAKPKAAIADANRQIEALTVELKQTTDPAARASIVESLAAARQNLESARLQLLNIPAPSAAPAVLALPAEISTVPSNKGYITTGILALIVGLALGIGLAFVRERLDERVPDRSGFEKALGAPVIAVVPRVPGWRSRNEARVVSLSAPDSAAAESYRAARTTLLYLAREGGMNVVAVTGPGQAEGKTTTAANLAVSLAQAGKRVIAVSADLRKPRMHRFFHLGNTTGTADVLTGRTDVVSALARTEVPNLLVMSSGRVPSNPAELLASDAMDDMLAELRTIADVVLIDTPPTLVVSDMLGIAPKVDGVIVVADASSTHLAAIEQLRHQLERGGGTIIGGVFNNQDMSGRRGYVGYGYRDDYREEATEPGRPASKNGSSRQADNGAPTHRPVAANETVVREPSEMGF